MLISISKESGGVLTVQLFDQGCVDKFDLGLFLDFMKFFFFTERIFLKKIASFLLKNHFSSFKCILRLLASTQSSMQASPFFLIFLTYIVCLCLGCKALCIVFNFLVLRSICLSSFFIHF